MILRHRGRLAAAGLAALLALAGCERGAAPLPPEALQIRINLLCTTCDDFLRCERSVVVAGTNVYTLYRLREKSFWAQIATIWDYLIQSLQRKTSDQRPLTVYAEQNGLRVVRSTTGAARVDLVSGLIRLPDSLIDLRDGSWRSLQGEVLGGCVSMPRREGYAWVRELLGRPLPGATP